MRRCQMEEEKATDELVASNKLLVTSPEQLLFKRLRSQTELMQQYCKFIRKAASELCDELKVRRHPLLTR